MPRARIRRATTEVAPVREFTRKDWCQPCRTSNHRACDNHPNTHHVDKDQRPSCSCPCEGEITDSTLLIDLVADLRMRLTAALAEGGTPNSVEEIEEWAAAFAEKVVITLNDALVDDEGLFAPGNQDEIFAIMTELDEMTRTAPSEEIVAILAVPPPQSDIA